MLLSCYCLNNKKNDPGDGLGSLFLYIYFVIKNIIYKILGERGIRKSPVTKIRSEKYNPG